MCRLGLQVRAPMYDIPKGRKDGRRSKLEDTFNLQAPTLNASQFIRIFGTHGFSAKEMVFLFGKFKHESDIQILENQTFRIPYVTHV